jgi:hypothetical protein
MATSSQITSMGSGRANDAAVVRACEQLAELDLDDAWRPAHLPHISPARPINQRWTPPAMTDALRNEPAHLNRDGVLAVLGLHRLAAIEEALRAAPPEAAVTVALVTSNPGELAPLAQLTITELRGCLKAAIASSARPRLQIIHDESGALAAAAGVPAISDATESAVRIQAGRIVARADRYGACHAAASA